MTNMTVRMEEGLRMSRAIASLIATHLQLDPEDARGGAEAIWELLRQVETPSLRRTKCHRLVTP